VERPKSADRDDPAGTPADRTGDPDPGAHGIYDHVTGLSDFYEQDDGDQGSAVTWEEILGHWDLLVADFAEHYGIRLHTRPRMTWAEFRSLVAGLLAVESRLWRATRPPEPEQDVLPSLGI
jgi:hypothetical protein